MIQCYWSDNDNQRCKNLGRWRGIVGSVWCDHHVSQKALADNIEIECSKTEETSNVDEINHPPHYTTGKIETIDVITDWNLNYCEGNIIKYLSRYKHKGSPLEDLKKAEWYLKRLIKENEK